MAHAPSLLATGGLDLRIAACADSKHMILASSADGMNPDAVDAAVGDRAVAEWDAGALAAETPVAADLDALVAKIVAFARADPDAAAVIVDNTSSDAVADRYGEWLARGVHVVTPNKKANSGALARFRRFRASADESAPMVVRGHHRRGATGGVHASHAARLRRPRPVRAGHLLRDDELLVQHRTRGGQPFSDVVLGAKKADTRSPTPRRPQRPGRGAEGVIAARESGVDLALDDVDVQSLVPAELEDCDVAEYERRLPEFDGVIAEQAAAAAAEGKVLRFVGKVDAEKGTGSVELAKFDASHPFAGLQGADNILEISTARYSDEMSSTPLIIRGPGAGAQVTAGGVFGDLCKLGAVLGARVPV